MTTPPRPAAKLLVTALIRATEAKGGGGMVIARGDAISGAVLLLATDRGALTGVVERVLDMDGAYRWAPAGPKAIAEPGAVEDYVARRRRSDPDLWVVELDSPDALGLARAMLG